MKNLKGMSHAVKSEMLTKLPLVEIAGDKRVLIENHMGVVGYSMEEVMVRVCYGVLSISGCNLRLMQISRDQLVIKGKINNIAILGR